MVALAFSAMVLVSCTGESAPSTTALDGQGTSTTDSPGTTSSTATTQPAGIMRPDLSGVEGLSVGMRQQLEDLIVTAQEIRELPLLTVPQITVLDDAAFDARVRGLLQEGAEDVPADSALYKMLGLLAPEADLEQMYADLYTEQVAGFYDKGEVVVPADQDSLDIVQQGTLLHELVHALTDQHFDYEVTRQQMVDEERYDELSAFRAFSEGDASFAELQWVQNLPPREMGEFIAASLDVDTTVLETMPRFIRDSLIFPYTSGYEFVEGLYTTGGWEAVNDVYVDMPDLPGSTEQIITPGDYARDLPAPMSVLDVTVPGYELEVTSVWGELGMRLMLDQGLGESAALPAVDGWGGDFYHQWFDGQNAALLLVFTGDTTADLEELRLALLDYVTAMVDEEDFAWVDEEQGLLYFIVADEVPVGESIRSAVGLEA
jgi:hypothetical protein